MTYHFNFNFVWRYFDKLYWGLVLSLELAVISILVGIVIGLWAGARLHVDGPRWCARLVTAYVEFIRNVPLLLLVYLVFYGIPSVGGFSYGPIESFIITLSIYAGGLPGRGVPRRARRGAPRRCSMPARRSA